jgi:hypothetical protein
MLATKRSRPRIEARQSEKADLRRRTVNRLVGVPDPPLAQVVMGDLSGGAQPAIRPRSYFER